jgi:hypothetical protein
MECILAPTFLHVSGPSERSPTGSMQHVNPSMSSALTFILSKMNLVAASRNGSLDCTRHPE